MRVAFLADTHFGARADSLIFNQYFSKFYRDVFFRTLDKYKVKKIIHFGDLVDRRKFINFNILNTIRKDFIKPCQKRGISVDVIIGNHDAFFKNTNEINAVRELFSESKIIKVYEGPTEVDLDGLKVLYLPWINLENQEQSTKLIETTKAKVVMGHLELSGFYMYRGMKNDSGMDKKAFKKFKQVFTGHYHTKSDDGKIFYLGSPYEITFADLKDPKGFHLYDTKSKKKKFVQNPYRMFHRIYYDDRGRTLEEILGKSKFDKLAGTYVKVVVSHKTNPFFFDKFIEKLYLSQPADVSIA